MKLVTFGWQHFTSYILYEQFMGNISLPIIQRSRPWLCEKEVDPDKCTFLFLSIACSDLPPNFLKQAAAVWNQNVRRGPCCAKATLAGFYHAHRGLLGPWLIIPGTYMKAGRQASQHNTGLLCPQELACPRLCSFDRRPDRPARKTK